MLVDHILIYTLLLGGLEPWNFEWLSIQLRTVITPTDELMFFRGVGQPPTSNWFIGNYHWESPINWMTDEYSNIPLTAWCLMCAPRKDNLVIDPNIEHFFYKIHQQEWKSVTSICFFHFVSSPLPISLLPNSPRSPQRIWNWWSPLF